MVSGSRSVSSRARGRRALIDCGRLAVVAVMAVTAACEQGPDETEEILRPVRYTVVVAPGARQARTYSGTARAELETDLSFRVGGTLTERAANVGDELAEGALVATLDRSDYQVRLNEAQAGLARAEAELRNATANYERTQDLYENRSASRTELDTARAMAESAEAQLRAATQQVEAARLQLSYTRLTAPQQCSVAQAFVEVNQNVSAGQPIVRLNCGRCAEVLVSVPETDISNVAEGMAVTAKFNALSEAAFPGRVDEVGVATGAGGTTYPVTVALEDGCTAVRSGMAADVTFDFPTGGAPDDLIVPYVSVGEDRGGNFVFVLEEQGGGRAVARRREVVTGPATGNGIVITGGLRAGEKIATAGVRRLEDGQQVRLLDEPA